MTTRSPLDILADRARMRKQNPDPGAEIGAPSPNFPSSSSNGTVAPGNGGASPGTFKPSRGINRMASTASIQSIGSIGSILGVFQPLSSTVSISSAQTYNPAAPSSPGAGSPGATSPDSSTSTAGPRGDHPQHTLSQSSVPSLASSPPSSLQPLPQSRHHHGHHAYSSTSATPTTPTSSHSTPSPHPSAADSSLDFSALRKKALSHTLTLDQHVTLGILYHERGDLRESSYHWQHASYAGDRTGMLLYGLALRHGWGIRKNTSEAFGWLKEAVGPILLPEGGDRSEKGERGRKVPPLMVADPILDLQARKEFLQRVDAFLLTPPVPKPSKSSKSQPSSSSGSLSPTNTLSPSTSSNPPAASSSSPPQISKSQLALAIYELGMSYLNAWGVDKDEDLALRHFELSGCLGDPDALNEAARLWTKSGPKSGYDYGYLARSSGMALSMGNKTKPEAGRTSPTSSSGSVAAKAASWSHRKKDYQRAALLYRLAEEHGASNVSNSWIYKEKYMLYKDVHL